MEFNLPVSTAIPVVRFDNNTYYKVQVASLPLRWTAAANQNFKNVFGDYIQDSKVLEATITLDYATEPTYFDMKQIVMKADGSMYALLPVGGRPC